MCLSLLQLVAFSLIHDCSTLMPVPSSNTVYIKSFARDHQINSVGASSREHRRRILFLTPSEEENIPLSRRCCSSIALVVVKLKTLQATMSETTKAAFPLDDLVPREETQALSFVQKFPQYNGTGITIGILDTGVDPGAAGLYNHAGGSIPKLTHVIDCTGSGDVSVDTEKKAKKRNVNGAQVWQVEGLSGKTLTLPGDWNLQDFPVKKKEEVLEVEKEEKEETKKDDEKEASDDSTTSEADKPGVVKKPIRLGILRAYDLFPKKLVNRIKDHRAEQLQQELRPLVAQVRDELSVFKTISKPTPDQVLQRQDLEDRLKVLQKKQDDPGPLYDCVVYYDGTHYRAAISDTGTFTKKAMSSYDVDREYRTFSTVDQYNYCFNFYNDGTILNICADAGAHASHVAGIASHNEYGVAPGANLISFKIGDSRLGSMETGTSLVRALLEAIRLKVNVINLSYGEGTCMPNSGRFTELANDLVYKHGIVFVSSAGNNGPALSTVGAPGGTSSPCLGIAAYVSPAMRTAEYSLRLEGNEPGSTYTWSSVGPSPDGDNGVNLTAPGGAITSVPNWCLQKSQLMNGTSMSSPHATGCVALLLSACKANGMTNVTPSRIQKAMENTALFMDNLSVHQQGWGMIQVEKAWDYLVAHKDCETEDLHFDVYIENRSGHPRGVYLRQPDECQVKHSFSVSVDPLYKKDDVAEETQQAKCNLEIKFRLETTEPSWVQVPDFFMVMHNGRSFKVDVDPTSLKTGIHTAKILAYDTERPERGVVFSIPITVAKPMEEANQLSLGELEYEPTEVKRFMLNVPSGATWMDVTLQDQRPDASDGSPRLMILHTVQLMPHAPYSSVECKKYYNLVANETKVTSIAVNGGVTCELVCARYWNALGTTKVKLAVEFRGVRASPNRVHLTGGGGGSCVRLLSEVRNEFVNPSAKLTKWKTPIRPKADGGFVIAPLGDERDIIPSTNKHIYEIVLTYEFTQEEDGSVRPRCPALQGFLYESAYESQLMILYDGEKKLLGVADSWPDEIKVPKGTITIRMQVRHDKPEMLEKLKDTIIWIERKLDKEISLSVYTSKENLMVGSDSFKRRTLRKGCNCSVFFAEPPASKLPTGYKAGDILFGKAHFESGDSSLPGDGKCPGGYAVSYVAPPKPAKGKDGAATTPDAPDERSVEQKMAEAVRDLKVEYLGKLTKEEKEKGKFEELYAMLEKEYGDHLPLLLEGLKHVDNEKKRKDRLDKVVEAADKIISQVSEDELALHFGKNHEKDDPKAAKERKEMTEKKATLCEAWARKARALIDQADKGDDFDAALKELKKWINIDKEDKFVILVLEREKKAKRYGALLKFLNSLVDKDCSKGGICSLSKSDIMSRRAEVLDALGYSALFEYDKAWRVISNPKAYKLF
jgi:tripeptidyl-peptidase-2